MTSAARAARSRSRALSPRGLDGLGPFVTLLLLVGGALSSCRSAPDAPPSRGGDAGAHARVSDARATTERAAAPAAPTPIAPGPAPGADLAPALPEHPSLRAAPCATSRLARVSDVGELRAQDVDGDGALDVVERVSLANALRYGALLAGTDGPSMTLPWPRVARGRRCVFDDPASVAYARARCPAAARSFVLDRAIVLEGAEAVQRAALERVACARAWGASPEEISRRLPRRWPAGHEALSSDALVAFARGLGPPWPLAR